MTPEQQQQFNQELQMVIAIAAQIYRPEPGGASGAVNTAIEIIRNAEAKLKEFYEPAKEAPVQASPAADSGPNRVGQGAGEPTPAVPAGTPKPSRKVILDSISECSRVILAKKLRSQDQLVKMVEAFAVRRKEDLNEAQAIKLLEQLTEITKE